MKNLIFLMLILPLGLLAQTKLDPIMIKPGKLTVTELHVIDENTIIYKDGDGNLVLVDAITGSKKLSELITGNIQINETLTGLGTQADPLGVNTSTIATKIDLDSYWSKTEFTDAEKQKINDIGNATQFYGYAISATTPVNGKIWVFRDGSWILEDKPVASGSPAWGEITGTLSSQTDLQTALDTKQDALTGNETIFSAWDKNATDDFDGDYNSLTNRPTISDWAQANTGTIDPSNYSDNDTQLSDSQVQDIVGGMVNGNSETNIDVTYSAGKLNFNVTGGGSEMVYPAAGIPVSTGTAWGTSITNNSANWNTAYGWGDHAAAGYLTSEVDGSTTNELQTLSLAGNELAISDGNTVDLSTITGGSATTEAELESDLADVTNVYTNNDFDISDYDGYDYWRLYVDGIFKNVISTQNNFNLVAGDNLTATYTIPNNTITLDATYNQLTQEEVQDFVGSMVSGNREYGVSVVYDDDGNEFDFDLDIYELVTLSNPVLADYIPIVQNSTHNEHKTSLQNIKDLIGGGSQLTQEEVQDYVGSMVSGNTETGISVTYQTSDNTFDFVVDEYNEGMGIDITNNIVSLDIWNLDDMLQAENGDHVAVYDLSESDIKRISLNEVVEAGTVGLDINGLDLSVPVSGDYAIFYDTSANIVKKADVSNFLGGGTTYTEGEGIDIDGSTIDLDVGSISYYNGAAESDGQDRVPVYDVSVGTTRYTNLTEVSKFVLREAKYGSIQLDANWKIVASGTNLFFQYDGVTKMTLTSTGAMSANSVQDL